MVTRRGHTREEIKRMTGASDAEIDESTEDLIGDLFDENSMMKAQLKVATDALNHYAKTFKWRATQRNTGPAMALDALAQIQKLQGVPE